MPKKKQEPYVEVLTAVDRLRLFIEERYGGRTLAPQEIAELGDLLRAVDALMAVLPDEQQ